MSGFDFGAITAATARPAAATSKAKTSAAVEDFLNYMKQSPAERMADSWLKAHGLSREKLAAMTPEQREAVLKQMAKELQEQVAQAAQQTPGKKASASGL